MAADRLTRLLAPRTVVVVGGREAAEVVRQCRALGFAGPIWPVNPKARDVAGLACFRDVADLPAAPDAAFVAVPREATVEVVRALAALGAGGAVCYASGFAEVVGGGALQADLVRAAGAMPILGPNCYGAVNYLDGVALWPDQHGGCRTGRGVAVISQSGNMGINLTMQDRSLPIAYVISVGNQAVIGVAECMAALLADRRVSAIGIFLEGLGDVLPLARAAVAAMEAGVPVVALKSGRSRLGARTALSHTGSMVGSDQLYDAFFERYGIARVATPDVFLESLKLLHAAGPLPGPRLASMSCSGGEAGLAADLIEDAGLELPPFPEPVVRRLEHLLGDRVAVANPLDYHTYIWGDRDALEDCFQTVLGAGFDGVVLFLDFPRPGTCDAAGWTVTLEALIEAGRETGARAFVASTLPETLPGDARARLLEAGIAPLQGIAPAVGALAAAAAVGVRWRRLQSAGAPAPLLAAARAPAEHVSTLDGDEARRWIADAGVQVPEGRTIRGDEAAATAGEIGFPVALKASSPDLAHKTEAGAVVLDLATPAAVDEAARTLSLLADDVRVEHMVTDTVAELIVGVVRDPIFGLALLIGSGGVLVEMMDDHRALLLPASRRDIVCALESLRVFRVLAGHRGRPAGDVDAAVDAIEAVARLAEREALRLVELDVNPLLVRPQGSGAVAVDVLIRIRE